MPLNLPELRRALDHLAVLVEIRSRRSEKEDEDNLAIILLALLATYYEDKDSDVFKSAFLVTIRNAFEELDPNDEYGELITQEIAFQSGFLTGFLQDLKNDKISEGMARARAVSYARSLGKLREEIGLTGEGDNLMRFNNMEDARHCSVCPEYDQVVKPASEWLRIQIYPKSMILPCGSNCKCFFTPA